MNWSISAHNLMRRCQRAYYFQYYVASHNARDRVRKEAFYLKQLQPLAAWRGSIVHSVIEDVVIPVVRAGKVFPLNAALSAADRLMGRQFNFSASRAYRTTTKTAAGRDYCALQDHEYATMPTDGLRQVVTAVQSALTNLGTLETVIEAIRSSYRVDTEIRLDFPMYGARVWCQPDLVIWKDPQKVLLIDWKVAESLTSDYSWQVMAYSLALQNKFALPPEAIEVWEVNLLIPAIKSHAVNAQRLHQIHDFIFESIEEMNALIPAESTTEYLGELALAKSQNSCAYCKYRRLCAELITSDVAL